MGKGLNFTSSSVVKSSDFYNLYLHIKFSVLTPNVYTNNQNDLSPEAALNIINVAGIYFPTITCPIRNCNETTALIDL